MRRVVWIPLAALVAVVLLAAASATAPQDKELEQRVAKLEKEVAGYKSVVRLLDERVAKLEKKLEAWRAFSARVPEAAARMEAGITEVKDKGFLKAGLNLHARAALLDTLSAYADTLREAAAARPEGDGEQR